MTDQHFDDAMAPVKQRYVARLKERIAVMRPLAEQMARGALSPEDMEALRIQAHQLAGNGMIFGFHEISQCGRALETMILAGTAPAAMVPALNRLIEACEMASA